MEIKKIGPERARALGRLEAEIYPPQFCLGWQDFAKDIQEAEDANGNFSFGLFEKDRMVGYIVAHVEDGEIFVSDLAILPHNRVKVAKLLISFFEAAARTKRDIHAECRKNSFRLCIKHAAFFRRFGYVLSQSNNVAPYGGEKSWEIRFSFKLN